jgi:hypothetical protein
MVPVPNEGVPASGAEVIMVRVDRSQKGTSEETPEGGKHLQRIVWHNNIDINSTGTKH